MFKRLIAVLFLSRDVAHREHLRTTSYAQHVALGSFYDELVDLTDGLVEMYQGRNGIVEGIPLLKDNEVSGEPADMLEQHLKFVETNRYTAVDKTDSAIQNHIDTIVGLYLTTLYKLRNLK
jgi:hypothetical protein